MFRPLKISLDVRVLDVEELPAGEIISYIHPGASCFGVRRPILTVNGVNDPFPLIIEHQEFCDRNIH